MIPGDKGEAVPYLTGYYLSSKQLERADASLPPDRA